MLRSNFGKVEKNNNVKLEEKDSSSGDRVLKKLSTFSLRLCEFNQLSELSYPGYAQVGIIQRRRSKCLIHQHENTWEGG